MIFYELNELRNLSYKEAEKYLLKPKDHELEGHGIGEGRGYEKEQIRYLLNTQPGHQVSDKDVDSVFDKSQSATNAITNTLNSERIEQRIETQ